MPRPRIDMLNRRFGRLLVTGDAAYKGKSRQVTAICDCGTVCTVLASNVRSGNTTSCGCVHKEAVTTHGQSQSRLYKIWKNMHERCYVPSHAAYSRYGGMGIDVCPTWSCLDSFVNWAIQNGYGESLTLDRKDSKSGYSPDNCRWATASTQARNRRSARGSSSRFVGVSYYKATKKWKAHIKVSSVLIHLGYHETPELAAAARNKYILDHNLVDYVLNPLP